LTTQPTEATDRLYGRSDIESISHPGGCSHEYDRTPAYTTWSPDRTVPSSDCPDCHVALIALGWVRDTRKVALTVEEQEQRELAEKEGAMLTQTMAQSFARSVSDQVTRANAEQEAEAEARHAAAAADAGPPGVNMKRHGKSAA
jgi:hypothetical protein